MSKTGRRQIKVFDVINYTLLTIISLACILPFIYIIAASFSCR